MFLYDCLVRSAERFPTKTAVVQGSRRVSYAFLAAKAASFGDGLRSCGVSAGERILLLLENSPDYIVSYFGSMEAGGIVVPISPQSSERTLDKVLVDCRPSVIVTASKLRTVLSRLLTENQSVRYVIVADAEGSGEKMDKAAFPAIPGVTTIQIGSFTEGMKSGTEGPGKSENEVALLLYTSGTTREPKGVMLTHGNLAANATSIVAYLKLTDADSAMVILPFHYSYGNSLLTTHVMAGGCLVIENSFVYPNVVLDRMLEEEVTGFSGVPSTFAILLNRSKIRSCHFPTLRYVTQAGGAMLPKHAEELTRVLPNARVFIMYGQTEATARLSYLDPSDVFRKAGSIGRAIPGVTLTVMKEDGSAAKPGEIGEIVAEGKNLMAGYWNDAAGTAAVLKEGRLHTGDLAWVDEEGFLYIYGRKDDLIKTKGERISPKEIEETLCELDGISEAAVIGVPDEILGQAVKAFCVRDNGNVRTMREVLKHCAERLDPVMVPKYVEFIGEIPKTPRGKIDKSALNGMSATS